MSACLYMCIYPTAIGRQIIQLVSEQPCFSARTKHLTMKAVEMGQEGTTPWTRFPTKFPESIFSLDANRSNIDWIF